MPEEPPWLPGAQLQSASTITQAPDRARNSTAPAPKQRQSGPRAQYKELGKQGFQVPQKWTYDGCRRREAVVDLDAKPPRVVRKVGWNFCICCSKEFWSQNVICIRLCYDCKYQVDTSCQEKTTGD